MAISQQTKFLPFIRQPVNPSDKYELVFSDSRTVRDPLRGQDITVYRIRALRNVGLHAIKGEMGGYVQTMDNLSHEGDCWLANDACAIGRSRIWGSAWVGGNAQLRDEAWAFEHAHIEGHCALSGCSRVFGHARVSGLAAVSGNALVSGHAMICDQAHIVEQCWISGQARIGGDAWCAGSQILDGKEWCQAS